jgi:fumarylacetoacetase
MTLDATHDPARRSWVASANGHADFPIQNLPFGVFSPPGGAPRAGVAIGDSIFDLCAVLDAGLLEGEARRAVEATEGGTLNGLLGPGAGPRGALRAQLSALLAEGSADRAKAEACLHDAAGCTLHLPAAIGDYTDFYVGIHHATNIGKVFRPDNPLLPNYKYVPIGYHGRASSVRVSGTPVRRPKGQLKAPDAPAPEYGPCRRLDYELELGVWVGPGNDLGDTIAIGDAPAHIGGYCLLNDWSARDIQAWEYQPLGPFLSKNFGSTISPWIITPEALAPFRAAQMPRLQGDPQPLPYLWDAADQDSGALAIDLTVLLMTPGLRAKHLPPHLLARSHTRHMYWTVAQMIAHHASGGCDLHPGDLLGSGTISTPDPGGYGSLLELTRGGTEPLELVTGEVRRFLEDGDEIILRAHATRPGAVGIGFGECRAVILPAS